MESFDDAKLMAFWQQQRTDALKALEVADRQINCLSSLAIRNRSNTKLYRVF